jgi:hypothetical protein
MYCEQLRSGGFQKEMEEVNMTLGEFKEHFLKCMKKYLENLFHDVLSSKARRKLYEKLKTDTTLATTIILASDYSAILDGHSQDNTTTLNTIGNSLVVCMRRSTHDYSLLLLASTRLIETQIR